MNTKISHIITVFAIILVLHIIGVMNHLYTSSVVLIDIPQHLLAGVLFAMIFVYVAQKNKYFSSHPSSFIFVFSILGFALLGSFTWEIFEFLSWRFQPGLAEQLKWYSPDLLDALSDMAAGLLGSVAFILFARKKR